MSCSISSSKDSCYPGTTILVNKLGLKSQEALDQAEKIAVTLHSVEIEKEYNGLPLSFNYYCSIHKRLFGDIYEWAGSLRTVEIAKKETKFCKPEDIFQIGEAMFLRLQKNSYFKYLPRVKYIENISEFYNDLNLLHPFREGNGRTQRLFFSLLIRHSGHNIDFAAQDLDRLMLATIYAAQGIPTYLEAFFDSAII